MRLRTLVLRSLLHYRRGHAAVVLGVAIAVAVLGGAVALGHSVKASLRALFLERLGAVEATVTSARFFREELAEGVARAAAPPAAACPLLAAEGTVQHEPNGRRAARVRVYGVDARFWAFHGVPDPGLEGRQALLGAPLAEELAAAPGSTVLLRLERASDVPASSLFGEKEDVVSTLRLTVAGSRGAGELGEFSLRPGQQAVKAVFVPLRILQRALKREGRVNTVLVAGAGGPLLIGERLRAAASLEDLGLRLRALPERQALSLESPTGLLDDRVALAAQRLAVREGFRAQPVLTYLATAIRVRDRSVPYSVVSGLEPGAYESLAGRDREPPGPDSIVLNDWTARELGAAPGDPVVLEYLLWKDEGGLETRRTEFRLAAVVPLQGAAADPDLAPEYPGITTSLHLADWDPPFPVDLSQVKPRDEDYWDRHRTTPKAFVPLGRAQQLWGGRLGRLTSLRLTPAAGAPLDRAREALAAALVRELNPVERGLSVTAVRAEGLAAAEGATDFAAYFTAFSVFLMASALLLAGLFFRLGVEQRAREIGVLRALGFPPATLRRLFLGEGLLLAAAGGVLGTAAAAGWAALLLVGLRTLWVDAVGTRRLALALTPGALAVGALAGIAVAAVAIAFTLRGLGRLTPRGLAAGRGPAAVPRWAAPAAVAAALGGTALIAASALGRLDPAGGFFGGGALLLAAALLLCRRLLAAGEALPVARPGAGWVRLGLRNATERPGRSLLAVALIASATFLIAAVGAFRRAPGASDDPRSGTGGYALVAESVVPLHHDLATAEGRQALGFTAAEAAPLQGAALARFRLKPGDDASCLNLYRPQQPAVLGVPHAFVEAGRFSFQASLAASPEERANPWRLLERPAEDGVVPIVADGDALEYVLHRGLGDVITFERPGAAPLRLRVVGALRHSVFQGELLMGEEHFRRAFPEVEGYRFFLAAAPPPQAAELSRVLEERLGDYGFDAGPAGERLARFARVESTYLDTFQTLGGLGLVLGTLGLATVLLRNALERRRELAVMRAVGFGRGALRRVLLVENALLLLAGLAIGVGTALPAVLPALRARGGAPSLGVLAALLLASAATGLLASLAASAIATRGELMASLRAE
ncbi:MAG TPA: ABC transporter permease [Vicinamibacteria bacterium]